MSENATFDSIVNFIRSLTIARIGKGPYVLRPTVADHRNFRRWQRKYTDEAGSIIDEDLLVNEEKS